MKAPGKLSDSTIHLKVNILKSVLREAVRRAYWMRTRSTGCHSPIASKHSIRKEQP